MLYFKCNFITIMAIIRSKPSLYISVSILQSNQISFAQINKDVGTQTLILTYFHISILNQN